MLGAEPVEVRAVLPAQVQQVLEAGGRDEGRPRALALEERVRRDGRAVREPLDRPRADRARGREHRLLLPRRGRHLRRPHPPVVDEHGVREGAADVDAEDRHTPTLRSADYGNLPERVRSPGVTRARSNCRFAGAGGEPVDLWRTLVVARRRRAAAGARSTRRRARWRSRCRPNGARPDGSRSRSGRTGHATRRGPRPQPAGRGPSSAWSAAVAPRPAARRGPVRVLRPRRARPRPGVGGGGRRADGAERDRLRGGREDRLHDELHVVGHRAHGRRARRAPRRAGAGHGGRRRTAAPSRRPQAWPTAPEDWYRDVARAGYRGAYLRSLADVGRRRRRSTSRRSLGARTRASRRRGRARAARAARASGRTRPRT